MPHQKKAPSFAINPPVFFGSACFILLLVALAALLPTQVEEVFKALQLKIVANFGWFYMLSVAIVLVFCVTIAFSSNGQIKLGPDHIEPDFSKLTWFSMLFSAGMGIGLVFFGVAEPIMHYINPPSGDPQTIMAAKAAMSITFFHWGLHAWAIYAVVGLILAYFTFRHQLPLSIRSGLYPLIGNRIYGYWGHTIDIAAVLGTLFGIATSLGLGVIQINSGLDRLLGIPVTVTNQLILIFTITVIATISVTTGLKKGIRRLSELNLILALTLLIFVFLLGPTVHLLQLFVQNIGEYLTSIVTKTFNLYAYESTGWIGGWTLFYWGWWISWSPFVGTFIARISRGRTIREFIFGVLFVPVGFTFIWMTVFGNTAIYFDMQPETYGILSSSISNHAAVAMFELLNQLPWSLITSTLAIFIITLFFITSADSGSLVIDNITSGGKKTSVWQRIFWASMCGIVAATLLLAGGLSALQTAALVSALPFTLIILIACYGLLRSLQLEKLKQMAFDTSPHFSSSLSKRPWKQRLHNMITYPEKPKVLRFLTNEVYPALEKVAEEFKKQELEIHLSLKDVSASITIAHGEEYDFHYAVHAIGHIIPHFALDNLDLEEDDEVKYYRAEVYLSEGGQHYDIMGCSQDEIITDVLSQYDKHIQFLHLAR